jgi:hypothetical protein
MGQRYLAGLQEDGDELPEPSGIEAGYVPMWPPETASMAQEREVVAV